MATDIFVNIKDLPELTEAKNGDYIVVESTGGTSIIDFKNFIIPSANSIITNTVTQNTDSLINLSSYVSISDNKLSAAISILDTSFTNLSTTVSNIVAGSPYKQTAAKTQITITTGNREATGLLPSGILWTTSDIFISPANAYAAKFPAYATSIDTMEDSTIPVINIRGKFTRPKIVLAGSETPLRINTTSLLVSASDVLSLINNLGVIEEDIAAAEDAIYNIYAIKFLS